MEGSWNGMLGSRPGHSSVERGKQAQSDPEAGDCCQAEGDWE